jgi:DMSO/TMAO reductase YedYZ molybdopterin-dependent catalytic subunit
MSCVSNSPGGDLIGTNFWTGVPFKDVLVQAGVLQEAMDDRTLLVYAMNGEPLTAEHGFPLRLYIPNHYGMKQPKWRSRLIPLPG